MQENNKHSTMYLCIIKFNLDWLKIFYKEYGWINANCFLHVAEINQSLEEVRLLHEMRVLFRVNCRVRFCCWCIMVLRIRAFNVVWIHQRVKLMGIVWLEGRDHVEVLFDRDIVSTLVTE